MVHYVIQEVDCGAPILVQEVEMKSDDKLEDLQVSGSQSYQFRSSGSSGDAVTPLWSIKRNAQSSQTVCCPLETQGIALEW